MEESTGPCVRAVNRGEAEGVGSPRDQQSCVLGFLACFGPVRDEYVLQALVLVAQELGLLKTEYKFDFRRNVPFSSELSSKLDELVESGEIVDSQGRNTLSARAASPGSPGLLVRELQKLDPGALLSLSRLLTHVRAGCSREKAESLLKQDRVSPECLSKAVAFATSHLAS